MKYLLLIFVVFLAGCTSITDEMNKTNETDNSTEEEKANYTEVQEEIENPFGSGFGSPFQRLPSCGSNKEFFTVPHIALSNLNNIVPLGNFNPSGHVFPTNHLYFHLKGFQGQSSSSSASIVAPGDIWVTRIDSSEYTMNGQRITDYKMDFSACEEVKGYFIHLASLSEKLMQSFGQPSNCKEYETGGINYKNCEKSFFSSPILLKAGEPLGTVGGSSDFGLADLRTPELSYANRNRWYDEPLHRVCPLDYFIPDVKSNLYSLLGNSDMRRIVEPLCGEVNQDVEGTAQGVWFAKGTKETYPEDSHIALAHDNINPVKGVFSVGTSVPNLQVGTYYFNPKNSGFVDREFKDVNADGNVYCYEPRDGFSDSRFLFVILIQLKNPTSLVIEKQDLSSCGSGPWLFGSSYAEFER
ncbi:MAG: hypothetical protein HYT70_01240 [Candidatus Aenigmarchaeota archaeon]|nr:hypothetical protein [Candidatus Aenigmarchaeota archaeon]